MTDAMWALRMVVLAAPVVFWTGASLAQGESYLGESDRTIVVGERAIADAEIADRIDRLLSEIEGFNDVGVTVSGGVVTLTGEVLDTTTRDRLAATVERVEGVVAIENETEIVASLGERLAPAAERLEQRSRDILANAPIFMVAVVVFLLIALFGWILTTRLGILSRLAPNNFIADVYRAVARVAFVVVGVVVALDIMNATALIGAVLGAAGVVGLAIGFAVRDTVENFIASVLLSLRQPFRPNDVVEIEGDVGRVARLTSRATILISPEGNHIRIPNATVFKGRIVNFSRDPNRRFSFNLGVDADADLTGALATGVEALEALGFVLSEPPVGAWIAEVGDSNVVLTFAGWVDQTRSEFLKARGEAIRAVKTALEGAGYGLPEPIYRMRLDDRRESLPASQRPTSRPGTETPLPTASDPEALNNAAEEAVQRERSTPEAEGDLLAESPRGE